MEIIIREAKVEDAEQIAIVHVNSWKTTYKGIVPDDYLASLGVSSRVERWEKIIAQEDTYTFVAEETSGNIVGFSNGGMERTGEYDYKGELYAIYILKEYQRCGIGTELVKPLVKKLLNKNIHSMLVWVLEKDDSRDFYQKLGATEIDKKSITIGGAELNEVAYGWQKTKGIMDI